MYKQAFIFLILFFSCNAPKEEILPPLHESQTSVKASQELTEYLKQLEQAWSFGSGKAPSKAQVEKILEFYKNKGVIQESLLYPLGAWPVLIGDLDLLKKFKTENISLKEKTSYGYSLLFLASELGYLSIVEYLIQEGLDPKELGPSGFNLLQIALYSQNLELIKYILDKKYCDLNHKDEVLGETAYTIAEVIANPRIIELLKSYEVNTPI